jgi:E3 ubiquitin-protein ligase FANCL
MCEICYAYRSATTGAAPDRVCEEEACSRPFHASCLLSWLQAVPGARRSFDTVFGACPYCSAPITVSVAAART